jgi:hypothetical protein
MSQNVPCPDCHEIAKLLDNSIPLEPEAAAVIDEHFFELLEFDNLTNGFDGDPTKFEKTIYRPNYMKPEQQRIAIAATCGIVKQPNAWSGVIASTGEFCTIPDYLNDLNAMHEAEKLLTPEQFEKYLDWLDIACGGELELSAMLTGPEFAFGLLHSTSAQRADAFLRTLNLWKD